ncbi:unnamed protein product [Medioppia subpectinata]|uniref:Uncharacterized protein n=1 Tax=Medioppia subpectinata TaxID=1979941 RepID=A0A7R9KHL6_9ACAR|nr:unnamed protein product [Medioppia subpectinata]CAG2103537.1 unnamed protein product [Medioppia subpectinata]
MSLFMNERSVFGDLNATNELEMLDNIYDRTIITANSANILNILSESSALNPEEEVIRKRGRKKTPKVSQLPLRRSPRKAPSNGAERMALLSPVRSSAPQSDGSHDYFLRTPSKKTPSKSSTPGRTPRKTPSKSSAATPSTPRRVSPRKRLQLDSNDSGLGLTPSPSLYRGQELTPVVGNGSNPKNSKSKSSTKSANSLTRRRRRRYF